MKKIENSEMIEILKSMKKQHIVIISAFVNRVSDLLQTMLKNENSVELYTGTLNYFNNPFYMKELAKLSKECDKFTFNVNFDPDTSTHWKVYAIGCKDLYVGSANFTSTGISLKRDTLLNVINGEMCTEYLKETKNDCYTSSKDSLFEEKLEKYTAAYRRQTKSRFVYNENMEYCEISLFICDEDLGKTEKEISKHLQEESKRIDSTKKITRFVVYEDISLSPNQIFLSIDIDDDSNEVFDINYFRVLDVIEYIGDENDEYSGGHYIYAQKVRKNEKNIPLKLTDNVINGIKRNILQLKDLEEKQGYVTKKMLIEWSEL